MLEQLLSCFKWYILKLARKKFRNSIVKQMHVTQNKMWSSSQIHKIKTTTISCKSSLHNFQRMNITKSILLTPFLLSVLACSNALEWRAVRRELQTSASTQRCSAANKTIVEGNIASNGQPRIACACHDNISGNGATLTCNDACQYCNQDLSICGFNQIGESYGPSGKIVGQTMAFRYDKGPSSTTIFTQYLGCTEASNGQVTCTSCNVFVNATQCDSCQLNTCSNGQQEPSFNCGNVESGAVYNLCDSTILPPSGSIFEYLTTNPNEYQVCYLGGQPQVPTAAPLLTSAPTFINNTQCPLRISTGSCDSLIQNQQPISGCDCYNYCGGKFQGCCGINEPCSLACAGSDFPPVAGCRLDAPNPPGNSTTEPGCNVPLGNGQTEFFPEGASFGNLVTNQCGNSTEFPCFCASLSEPNSIRCPYCPFVDINNNTICARSGENATFYNQLGAYQTCRCQYAGNGTANVACTTLILPPPPPQCSLESQTNMCSMLTATINPVAGCGCYNFCDGKYAGCCPYNEACTVNCTNATSSNAIVAGCQIDANRPPVTPAPVAPTPAPSAAPKTCRVQQNVQNCPALLANVTKIDGCECYNFCGSEFANCCSYDGNGCNVTCTGLPHGGQLTAGCQLNCKKYMDSCSLNSDCCSQRCIDGVCRTSAMYSSFGRPKIVPSSYGGAAGAEGFRRKLQRKVGVGGKLRGI